MIGNFLNDSSLGAEKGGEGKSRRGKEEKGRASLQGKYQSTPLFPWYPQGLVSGCLCRYQNQRTLKFLIYNGEGHSALSPYPLSATQGSWQPTISQLFVVSHCSRSVLEGSVTCPRLPHLTSPCSVRPSHTHHTPSRNQVWAACSLHFVFPLLSDSITPRHPSDLNPDLSGIVIILQLCEYLIVSLP